MRKRTLTLFAALLAVGTVAGCASSTNVPDLNSTGINTEALEHFKKILHESGMFDECEIKIQVAGPYYKNSSAIYVLDNNGKVVAEYLTSTDQFGKDLINAILDGLYGFQYSEEYIGIPLYYEYNLEISDNFILGSRTLPYGWKKRVEKAKKYLSQAGYPDSDFTYEDGKFSYGEYEISGDMAEDLRSAAFYKGGIWDAYETKLSEGEILTERGH